MLLTTLLDTWYLRERAVSKKAAELYRRSIDLFGEHLKTPATTDHLESGTITDWIMHMEELVASGRMSQRTIYGHRASIITLWRFAAEGGHVATVPARVRKVMKPRPNPIAWTPEEWTRMIEAADALEGEFEDWVPRSQYFGALMRVAYDTGLRRGDMFRLTQQDVRDDGRLRIVQHKTSEPHQPVMRPDTLERFRGLPGKNPLKWQGNVSGLYYWFGKLRRAAKLQGGCLHQTRRTGATLVVLQTNSVEQAKKYLGHRTGDMWRSYVDMGIADPTPVLPPMPGEVKTA